MALGKNIEAMRKARNWTMEDLSSRSGVEVGTINAIEKRDSKRTQFASAIAKAFGVTVEILELGGTINTNVDTDLPAPSDDNYALIPQYTAKAACGPAYHNGHVEVKGGLAFKRDWLSSLGLKPANLSVIAANGYSMSPTIQEGEVLLIDHSQIEPRDGKVFALARDDELVVKRLVRDFSGGWIIRSDNPDKTRYPDFHAVSNELRVVGRVVWRGGGL